VDKLKKGGHRMDKYKAKSITLRNSTHSKLTTLRSKIAPGLEISIPQTIDKLADIAEEKLSNSKGIIKGITNEQIQKS